MRTIRIAALAAALTVSASSAFSDEAARVYGRILAEAGSVQEKYAAATAASAVDDPDLAP